MFEIQGKYTKADIMIDNIEESALKQIHEMVNHPSCVNPIAIMPDVHAGAGCVIGFTMKCGDKIVPSFVGVDIGCGMVTTRFMHRNFSNSKLDIDFDKIDKSIADAIPMGKNVHDYNIYGDMFIEFARHYDISLAEINDLIERVDISIEYFNRSLGTLGGGNHFVEIGRGEGVDYWTTIHSGSRNFGLRVANYWNDIAKKKSKYTSSPYLEGDDTNGYLRDMFIAQIYARFNRSVMNKKMIDIMKDAGFMTMHFMGDYIDSSLCTIETCHNYISEKDNIIRKGAISAYEGEWVVVPFNMRDGLFICRGKGNKDWNFSGPHGAGRIMSRGDAKRKVTLDDFKDSMKGIYSSCIDESRIDESPMVYKDASIIENAIEPSLEIVYRVKPIYNRKG